MSARATARKSDPPEGRAEPREPVQARSKEKVERILDAAEALILGAGPDFTLQMRAIAKGADVSQGTLYDYFPTTRALVEALEVRAWTRFVEKLLAKMMSMQGQPVESIVRVLIETTLEEMVVPTRCFGFTPDPDHWLKRRAKLIKRFVAFGAERFLARGTTLSPAETEMMVTVATFALVTLLHVGTSHYPEQYADGRFTREVTEMITGYVMARSGLGQPAPASGVTGTGTGSAA